MTKKQSGFSQKLPRECVECNKSYEECRECEIYKMMNTPCHFCGSLRDVKPFILNTSRGLVKVMACERCRKILT